MKSFNTIIITTYVINYVKYIMEFLLKFFHVQIENFSLLDYTTLVVKTKLIIQKRNY